VKGRGEVVLKPRVYKSEDKNIDVGVKQDIWLTLARGEIAGLKTTANVKEPLIAPLAANTPVGDLTITTAGGETVAKVPLYPVKPVPEAGLWTRMVDTVALWF
jgi:D-alanyl-D-alanine carboxypeptidase (penicillin-binding protein 5/6)